MFFVRTASERDLAKVGALLGATLHDSFDALYGVDEVSGIVARLHSVPALKANLERKGSEFVVADDGKELAGMGYAALSPDRPKTAVLQQLYVLPRHQGQGIGRDLFAELETCFPDATHMQVELDPRNVRAVSFFERLGFARAGGRQADGAGRLFEKALDF